MTAQLSPAAVRKAAAFVEALAGIEEKFGARLYTEDRPLTLDMADGGEFSVGYDDDGVRSIGLPE